jgi:hypothetical protein
MKINEDLRVAMVETDTFREEHRGITVGIERQCTVVQTLSLTEGAGFAHQPLEEGQTVGEALGMPLYTEDGFVLSTLYRLNDAVDSSSHHTELRTGIGYCLVVEGVDEEPPTGPFKR